MRPFLKNTRALIPPALALLYVCCVAAYQPAFLSRTNLVLLLYYTSLLIPAVVGTYFLILLGLFDLSIGANAAAAGVICAKSLSIGLPVSLSILFAVLAGLLGGLTSWALVSLLRIPALIGTMITLAAFKGVALLATSGRVIGGLPQDFTNLVLGGTDRLWLPIGMGISILATTEVLSRHHFIFRRMYYAGSNATAAAHNGINVTALKCIAFCLAGIGSAVVGILQSARTQSASPTAFPDLALQTIAACIIGGMSLRVDATIIAQS
jgi:ribose transport system permease protein